MTEKENVEYIEASSRNPRGTLIDEIHVGIIIEKDGTEGVFAYGKTAESIKPLLATKPSSIGFISGVIDGLNLQGLPDGAKLELRKFVRA